MHIKVIVSQTAGVDVESKLHVTAVTRNVAAKEKEVDHDCKSPPVSSTNINI